MELRRGNGGMGMDYLGRASDMFLQMGAKRYAVQAENEMRRAMPVKVATSAHIEPNDCQNPEAADAAEKHVHSATCPFAACGSVACFRAFDESEKSGHRRVEVEAHWKERSETLLSKIQLTQN
ncbi:MAG: hypothetical protein PXY39_11910 [archaeon]|nr:hypothetical protein [archaeon]